MGNCRTSPTNNAIGFCLLPSELIERILLCLALPEIIQFKLVSKTLGSIISHQDFVRQCNLRLSSTTWLFLFKKRCHRYSLLDGFADRSHRWFRFPVTNLLKPFIFPGEDLFFLTASANIFVFASNSHRAVISVNLVTNTVRKIPPSPLGPRGTCSWRRSGMKLLPDPLGSDHFRFLFAELVENRTVVFEYHSESDTWRSIEAEEDDASISPRVGKRVGGPIFLSCAVHRGARETSLIAVTAPNSRPVILRPRFDGRTEEDRRLTVGFSWGNSIDRLHVCGDGYMMIVKSDGVDRTDARVRILKGVELWGLGANGRNWELMSRLPCKLMEEIKRHYGVMMGCLEGINGTINAALMSNLEGLWDIIWLRYDITGMQWTWVKLPDCKMSGLNMAGIAFSSGLTLH